MRQSVAESGTTESDRYTNAQDDSGRAGKTSFGDPFSDSDGLQRQAGGPALSLGVFEVGSIALGYQALAAVTKDAAIQVLEASTVAPNRFLILLHAPHENIKAAENELRHSCEAPRKDGLVDHEVVASVHADLLPAFYSLSQQQLQDALVVVETDSVSGLVASAQTLLTSHSLTVIELKGTRGLQGKGIGFFTGPAAKVFPAAEDIRHRLKAAIRQGYVEVIANPSPSFRTFFQL